MTNQAAIRIVELNNGALAHFLNRDYDKAISMLREAFETFEQHRQGQIQPVAQMDTQQGPGLKFVQPAQTMKELPTMMDCEVDNILKAKSWRSHALIEPTCSFAPSPSTACSMYNRALVLSDQDDFSLLVVNRHRTAAIILYNLALVHHNIGIHLGISAALPHALQLYELSLRKIDAGTSLDDVQKLLLATLNNMGNIYAHLFEYENTQIWLNNLRIVLAASTPAMTMDEDYVFFFLNSLFQGKELCFAPAA